LGRPFFIYNQRHTNQADIARMTPSDPINGFCGSRLQPRHQNPLNNWALAPEARSTLRLWGEWAAGPGSLFSFYLTTPIEERIPLLQSTGSLRNEGAPRVGVTRGGLYLTVTIDPVRAGGPGSLLFFPLDGIHRGEDATVAIHLTVKKRGVPHASGLRVGVCILPSQSNPSADKNCDQSDQKPHT